MILDYKYIQKQRKLTLSYINDNGTKSVLNFNVDKFKSYRKTPTGRFMNWDGSRCEECLTQDPHPFDIRTFFREINPKYQELINGKTNPRLYTFDIETQLKSNGDFTEPSEADMPIHTISCASPELTTLVMGDRQLSDEDIRWIQDQITEYLNNIEFFKTLDISAPVFKYQYFDREEDMIRYFLRDIVSKVPVLSGWNCIDYDWQYIMSRIKNFYPNISATSASSVWQCVQRRYTDFKNNDFYLSMPVHTPIIDMMDVIDGFDMSGLTAKESTSLDYIASETPGLNVHKIEYDGSLEDLYTNDYKRYVFYNAVDSILVQLIDKRYKTLATMYMQALYCGTKIQDTFSKIAVSEALTWNDFYEQGIKIVPEEHYEKERGRLQGAYVADPKPGLWNFVTCNDFSSLYPSQIIVNNLSFDNFVGTFYLNDELEKYAYDSRYVVIGPNVHKNSGTAANPEIGELLYTFIDDKSLEKYRKDPNYFVSVNGHVYKNDKDYAFKRIQANLKATRNVSKYLGKQLDALVMLDVEHILKNRTPSVDPYPDNIINALQQMGYDIRSSQDLLNIPNDQLLEFKRILGVEINFYMCKEQAMKLLGNSMYGGSSHIAFYWFNISLARDITAEGRNLIHLMEHHIPDYFEKNWLNMKELHQQLGISVDQKSNEKNLVQVIYGDTDSLYMTYGHLLNTIKGIENKTNREKLKIIVGINEKFLNEHNRKFMEEYYNSRHAKSIHDFELETVGLGGIWLNVKKRYAQILLWKDGKYFDEDSLPLKVKGLEMIKSSYPKFDREALKRVVRAILESDTRKNLWDKINILVQQEKMAHREAPIEDVCAAMGVNGYTKYIIDESRYKKTKGAHMQALDGSGTILYTAPKCPANVRALGIYNTIRESNGLQGDPIYGGKVKTYIYKPKNIRINKDSDPYVFAFQSGIYPKWATEYAPIDRDAMFQKYFLDPLNRICREAMGFEPFAIDGSKQLSLFDF